MTTTIHRNVMRRVHTIHLLRMVFSPVPLSLVLFTISLAVFGREVWVAHVLQNLAQVHSVQALGTFLVSAFENTRITVQIVTIAMIAAIAWFTYGIQRIFTNSYRFA